MLTMIIFTYMLLMWTSVVLLLKLLGDHVRLWLCLFVSSLREDAWFFLIGYWVLWWLCLWFYSCVYGDLKWNGCYCVLHGRCVICDKVKWRVDVSCLSRLKCMFLMHEWYMNMRCLDLGCLMPLVLYERMIRGVEHSEKVNLCGTFEKKVKINLKS